MKHLNQFILCNGKVPVASAGNTIDPHNPVNWMSYADAKLAAELLGRNIGFVFTSADPYWFLDIDHCVVDGQWSPIANQMMEVFPGAATELSMSGEGLHIFGQGQVPKHSCKNKNYGIEFYHEARFVVLTEAPPGGDPNLDWSATLPWLVDSYFPPSDNDESAWTNTPVPEWNGPESDQELLTRALRSGGAKNVFGGKASFKDLWEANIGALAGSYPAINQADPYDRSSADAALANHLAFWTGKNHERVRQLMQSSALVRDKWTKHKNYLSMTIINAVNGCRDVYSKPVDKPVDVTPETYSGGVTPIATTGVQFMSCQQQVEYFKNCVYIKHSHRVLLPNGMIVKPDVFKATYSGYTFSLDTQNEKTTRSAWEAFIDNQAVRFPKIDRVCFRPKLPPYSLLIEDGLEHVNMYIPIQVPRIKGDPTPFLNHLNKIFPNEFDRAVFLAYMAALVQHQGSKFQWCPILQGCEGNGKTLFSRIVANAIGYRYCHFPNASDLATGGLKFTGWILGKLFVSFEEIYVSDRRELTEPLKVFITNDKMEIQFKGQDQYTGDNMANIIMYSNHKDCMKLTYDGRRYWMYFSPQQSVSDLHRDGMDDLYFKKLYDWLKFENGYAICTDFLMDYQIPEKLNPATFCQRPPVSSSLDESVKLSLGVVEQHVMEAIEEERVGFRNGYISSKALKDLLIEIKMDNKISPHRRLTIMETLGYQKHPWLRNGRVNNPIPAEGAKITIYTNLDFTNMVQEDQSAQNATYLYELSQGYIQTKLEAVK